MSALAAAVCMAVVLVQAMAVQTALVLAAVWTAQPLMAVWATASVFAVQTAVALVPAVAVAAVAV